eukprot:TRINITY_DN30817_c0_g1_i1.p2 TRINITY_DN30817_c0_g1~~TRINITY_DN30817_c0_g1_i1.p2  ORF type:complete len:459 (+),score=155.19 TRINITY_DN30817_c0_g1_i1:67-1377(+)
MAQALRKAAPFLVVGEGIAAPLMALCLRSNGMHAHLLQRPAEKLSIDQGSVILTPRATSFLTEDLELHGARPPGNMVSNFYSYDNSANVLMNLNLDSLRAEDSGTFFCCQREVIERLLLRECDRPASQLEGKNPVKMPVKKGANVGIRKVTSQPGGSGVTVQFKNGATGNYEGIINLSRDMDAVPLINKDNSDVKAQRKECVDVLRRAKDNMQTPFWVDWTIPVKPEDRWELHYDELGEIVHRAGRRIFVRPTSAKEFSICMNIPRRAMLEDSTPAQHFNVVKNFWSSLDPITHALWKDGILPGLESTVTTAHKVNYVTPTYCFESDSWLEEGGKYIRIGPAAHGATAQPIDIADAIDFEDCFLLAEHLAEHGTNDLRDWCASRRLDVMDAMNEIAVLDDISRTKRAKFMFSLKRTYYMFSKTFSRTYKRTLRPYS